MKPYGQRTYILYAKSRSLEYYYLCAVSDKASKDAP
jgi:hypothetical protein